jgi:oxygen-independent coproporphyrinogen-3 oxidase
VPLGIYIAVPFCRTKCTFCNFASGVFSRPLFTDYVKRVCADIENAEKSAEAMGGEFERRVDSVYLGGGTPSVLASEDLLKIFETVRTKFEVSSEAEITVECAPGTLNPEMIHTLLGCGVNRVSLGVQSFVDEESRSVGRLHTRATTLEEIARLRDAGISNISVDLIAGLPHQTAESWDYSLSELIATGVPHCSVYMLEVDEDSRLGRELIAGGTRYHAHFVPDEDMTADLYVRAIERLNASGICQYEISNFAREIPTLSLSAARLGRTWGTVGYQSRHNVKYWTRQPYFGFGVDAHSMLYAASDPYVLLRAQESGSVENDVGGTRPCAVTQANVEAVRFSTPDSLEAYFESHSPFGKGAAPTAWARTPVSRCAAVEEEFFLGLRMNRGVDLAAIDARYGLTETIKNAVEELISSGLISRNGSVIKLTDRGRLISNEVFQQFITT